MMIQTTDQLLEVFKPGEYISIPLIQRRFRVGHRTAFQFYNKGVEQGVIIPGESKTSISYMLDISQIEDLEFDGIDRTDHPKYCDAFISSASFKGRELPDECIEHLNEHYGDFVHEKLEEYLH